MGKKTKKRFNKKWWFVTIVMFTIISSFVPSEGEEPLSESVGQTTESSTNKQEVLLTETVTEKSSETYQETQNTTLSQQETDITSVGTTSISYEFKGITYKIIEVDGGDLSGSREPDVAVNIGFGERDYWAFTNEYSQVVYVIADEIILQDELNELLLSDGRYYVDEAKVPGTELPDFDEGHIIADSLGGVSNAYNITPQDSTLNRYGDQAYMEKVIRDAGGCSNYVVSISYQGSETQIPLHYKFEYEINGNKIVDEFDNVNPDKVNATINTTEQAPSGFDAVTEVNKVDKNGNGMVTISEAKAAGFKMPIYSDHWLYSYMDDRDGDGMVGE